MKFKYLFGLVFVLVVFFFQFLGNKEVQAQNCPGGYCAGTTVLDIAVGCIQRPTYCETEWYQDVITCDNLCRYSNNEGSGCDGSCNLVYGHNGSCCVSGGGGGASPVPSGGGGGGGGSPTQGDIRSRAVDITGQVPICSVIDSSTNYVNGTRIRPNTETTKTTTGGQYVTWRVDIGNYTVTAIPPTPPPGYALRRACWTRTGNAPASGTGATVSVRTASVVTVNFGFVQQENWMQVNGGSIHSNGGINVSIPSGETLIQENSGLKPGVSSYATTANYGSGTVSTEGDSVQDGAHSIPTNFNYYEYYYKQFTNLTTLLTGVNDPVTGSYVVGGTGNLTLTGTWDVASGQTVVVFIPGDLTINTSVIVQNGGMLAFVVAGDVLVQSGVGTTSFSTSPNPVTGAQVSGIIIADGTFESESSGGTDEQLVVAGTIVANSVLLNRDLGAGNATYPAEVFIYRPDLWRNAPNELKEIQITWEEVNP